MGRQLSSVFSKCLLSLSRCLDRKEANLSPTTACTYIHRGSGIRRNAAANEANIFTTVIRPGLDQVPEGVLQISENAGSQSQEAVVEGSMFTFRKSIFNNAIKLYNYLKIITVLVLAMFQPFERRTID